MNLRDALNTAIARLRDIPELRDEASEDATLLLLHVLQISRATLLTSYARELTPQQQSQYEALIARRSTHEPVQYILAQREFYGIPLTVTPAVLVPRNLTEHLVEAVLNELTPTNAPYRIADVGTGSGAIAIALATHLPNATLTALDNSTPALEVANANAARNGLAQRIRCIESDLLAAVQSESPFDAIVANPPYIPTTDLATLAPQVRNFEPHAALFAGPDGLDLYRHLIPQAHAALHPNGLLALEFGPGQHTALSAMLTQWRTLRLIEDFDRTPRILVAHK
jgi:release factor glutamine methyltransferase